MEFIGLSYCWIAQYEEAIKWGEKAINQKHADRERFLSALRKAGISEHIQLSTIWSIGQSEIFKGDHTDRTCYDS